MFEARWFNTDSFFETLNANWDPQVNEEQRDQFIQEAYRGAKESTIDKFLGDYWEYPFGRGGGGPGEPIVPINGRPWQETEWKDYIIIHIRQNL